MKTFQKCSWWLALIVTFQLHAATNDAAIFSGTVVDAQGNPVAGAIVNLYQYPPHLGFGQFDMEGKQQVTADGQGAFEFLISNGMGLVVATKAGFAPVWQTWRAAPPEPQKIVLNTPSALAGVVVDDTGQPVADAEVWVAAGLTRATTDSGQPNFVSGKIARELFSAQTSAEGKFRIENFPPDAQAVLSATKPGKALRQSASPFQFFELPIHAGQEDITLILDPAGSVVGKIVARGTGEPLANAVVGLQPAEAGMGYFMLNPGTIRSAADGSFQIPDVPAGSYQIQAVFTNEPIADWVADRVPITVAAGETVRGVQIEAYKGAVVEVTVRGKDNHEPLANASVSVANEDYNRSGSTGTNGVVYFRLPPGQFSVFANKAGWSQVQAQTAVTEGQTTRVTLEPGTPFKVTGVVRDASGAPVAGAGIGVFPDFQGNNIGAKTDANGHYELNWQKPAWAGMSNQRFYLIARHSERKLAAMQEMEETMTNLDITLKPAMSVSGRVQDARGRAVTNVTARIALHLENFSFSISRLPVYPDEQGRIQAEALPMGERYGWQVSAPGYGNARQEMDAADPKADHYNFPPLTVKLADRKLAGRVLGTNGAPVAGVQIWLRGEDQPNNNATTDADGRFVFDAVCAGPVTVSANLKGAYASADAMGGDTNVVLRFNGRDRIVYREAPQTLTGAVYDSSGKPAVGAHVVVTPNWGPVDAARTGADGEYSVQWESQPGMRGMKYFVIARDIERNLAAIEAIGTNQTRVILRLEPALAISGTVQDAQGTPLTRVNVNLNIMAGNMGGLVEYEPIKVNPDGTFTIPALPMEQQYHVFVSANGYGSAHKSVGKTQSRTNRIQLSPFKLKTADRELAGRVLGADKKPLAGVQVNINGNGQPNGNMRTDETGHFKFKVCDGPIEIYAYSPSGTGRNNSGSAQARGGDLNVIVTMGVQPRQRQAVARETPLKPQPWTLSALMGWPANHKTGMILLLSLQAAVLVGTGAAIFWFTCRRRQRES